MFSHRHVIPRLLGLFCVLCATLALLQACPEPTPEPECTVKSDCKAGYFCNRGACKLLACENDVDCNNGEVCQNGSCVTGGPTDSGPTDTPAPTDTPPTDTPAPTDTPPTETAGPCGSASSCTADAECAGGRCVGGCCLGDCDANGGCPGNFKCNTTSNKCVQCLQDSDCPVLGQKCDTSTNICGTGTQCPGGKQPGPDGKCPEACAGTTCGPDETPDPDNNCTCVPKKGACEACTKDAECGIGNHCVEDTQKNKFCASDCTSTGKCDQGYTCLSLGDYSACMPSSGFCPCLGVTCQGTQKCCKNRGVCTECCEDADCQNGDVCRADGTCGATDPCKGVTCQVGQQCNSTTGKCDCQSPCPSGTCCGAGDTQCTAAACGGQTGTCNPACASGQQCCKSPIPGLPDQCLAQCQGGAGGGCKSDADCQSGETCCALFGNMCISSAGNPLLPLLCGGGGGNPGGGTQCTSDADCAAGETCQGGLPPILPGTCQKGGSGGKQCTDSSQCPAGQTCQGGLPPILPGTCK